ncbi:MAG: V-type ATP synthase subunit E family protein [Oscillospiraceae bacterium]
MNGIEKITAKITADVDAEIAAITGEANEKAAAITADFGAKAAKLADTITQKGETAAALREERLASVAQLEAKKSKLGAKQEMVSEAFDLALKDLCQLPADQYVDLLTGLVLQAVRTGREEVIFSQKDRTRYGKIVVTAANDALAQKVAPKMPQELGDSKAAAFIGKLFTGATAFLAGTAMLTLAEESRPMAGGVILRDGNVETNCAFETLIHLQRDKLAHEVAGVLFP